MEQIRIAITGANGFIGKNLLTKLQDATKFSIKRIERDDNCKIETDYLIHLAGINRSDNIQEFKSVNVGYTSNILSRVNSKSLKGIYFRVPFMLNATIITEVVKVTQRKY